jgi:hypothetical protein
MGVLPTGLRRAFIATTESGWEAWRITALLARR